MKNNLETMNTNVFARYNFITHCLAKNVVIYNGNTLFYKNAKVSTRDWTGIIFVDSARHWGSVLKIPKIIKICLRKKILQK